MTALALRDGGDDAARRRAYQLVLSGAGGASARAEL